MKMNLRPAAGVLVLVLAALAGAARAEIFGDYDHTLYVTIDSEPEGAAILSVPTNGTAGVVIGMTPMTLPVNMNWRSPFFVVKSWSRLRLQSTGGVATFDYNKMNRSYDVWATLAFDKTGFVRRVTREYLTQMLYDGDKSWDDLMDSLPGTRHLTVSLVPKAVYSVTAAPSQPVIPTVLIASGDNEKMGDAGFVIVYAPANMSVFADNLPAGAAPMRLMLAAGKHTISGYANGKAAISRSLDVVGGKTVETNLGNP